ncbi:MAG: 50S ribosomal protein L11 methyltransferase [Mariprofundaceae bacterium]|nr:50S ribosomal protein L11 methyltransferase [Mariprofundaceae bacterium]
MQAVKCLELRVEGTDITAEAFEGLAASLQTLGTSQETDADTGAVTRLAWFAMDEDIAAQRARITAAALLAGAHPEHIRLHELGDDWASAWQKHWQALPVGKRLWVRPSFCEPPTDDRIDIVLDPGMAFGTGTHATTQLCLAAIERICGEQMPQSMLDMGAGSGLLAIAAAKLGVNNVLAIDNDPTTVEACRVNAKINGVTIRSEPDDTPPQARFDLVVANILAGPLMKMAPKLAACVGRSLVLSGLLITQVEYLCRAYREAGLTVVRTDTQAEWAAVELRLSSL